MPFPLDPRWIKAIGSCYALLMGNKPTKTPFPGTLYLGIVWDLCNILPVIPIDDPFTRLLSPSPLTARTRTVVCGTFAQWQSSLKGYHFTLGPYPTPAPNSTDLLSSSCSKSSFSFTDSLDFHSILATGSPSGWAT